MVLMSTPAMASHAGMAVNTRPNGKPDEKDNATTEAKRHSRSDDRRLCVVAGFSDRAYFSKRVTATG